MNTKQAAIEYLEKGWQPVYIPRLCSSCHHQHYTQTTCGQKTHKNDPSCPCVQGTSRESSQPAKGPTWPSWQHSRLTAADIQQRMHESDNVGLLLGEPSGWLVDVDLDCEEAVYLAEFLLPDTLMSGRDTRPRSHYWYYAKDARTVKYQSKERGTLIELRSTGGQTVVAPSLHPEGDIYRWDNTKEPATIDLTLLKRRVCAIGIGALLAQAWPGEGIRHDAGLSVAGFFAQMGWPQNEAEEMVYHVAVAAKHQSPGDRKTAVTDTYKKMSSGQGVQGVKAMRDFFGAETVQLLQQWSRQLYTPRKFDPASLWTLEVVSVEEIPDEEIEWLYYPYIPLGYLTVLAGDSHHGKSRLTAALVTCCSVGAWLDTTEELLSLYTPANTLLLGTEDLRGTIKHRLTNYGADLRYCHVAAFVAKGDERQRLVLDEIGMKRLRDGIQRYEAKLIVIDPLQSFLPPGKSMSKMEDTRPFLDALSDLAEETKCAVLLVQHFNKTKTSEIEPEKRISGNQDWFNRPRSVLVSVKKEEQYEEYEYNGQYRRKFVSSLHAMTHLKYSIAGAGMTIDYQLGAGDQFMWVGPTMETARELLSPPPKDVKPADMDMAKRFLLNLLHGVEGMYYIDVLRKGKEQKFTKPALTVAATTLGIKMTADNIGTYWQLPGKYRPH